MKKTISIFLSIILFFTLTLIIYLYSSNYYLDKTRVSNYLNKISYVEKNNNSQYNNVFHSEIKKFYNYSKKQKLLDEEIQKIEQTTNFNKLISNIITTNLNNKKEIYTKKYIDNYLTKNITNKQIKNYIIKNDNKILSFNNQLTKISNKNRTLLKIINSNSYLYLLVFSLVLLILQIIINKKKSFSYIIIPLFLTNIFNIIISITSYFIINIKYNYKTFYYIFEEYINIIINKILLFSIISSIICIIIMLINEKIKKKNSKIKPRIRKVKEDEEDFSFGL